jgi:hypothetical protein
LESKQTKWNKPQYCFLKKNNNLQQILIILLFLKIINHSRHTVSCCCYWFYFLNLILYFLFYYYSLFILFIKVNKQVFIVLFEKFYTIEIWHELSLFFFSLLSKLNFYFWLLRRFKYNSNRFKYNSNNNAKRIEKLRIIYIWSEFYFDKKF